jgi:hypothetical protein
LRQGGTFSDLFSPKKFGKTSGPDIMHSTSKSDCCGRLEQRAMHGMNVKELCILIVVSVDMALYPVP